MIQSNISEAGNSEGAGGGEGGAGGLHISTHAVDTSDLDHLKKRKRDILDKVEIVYFCSMFNSSQNICETIEMKLKKISTDIIIII